MSLARIFRPDKSAMQSGKGRMKAWLLEFAPEAPLFIDPLMGWTGMSDTVRQLRLTFPSKEAAIAYAEKNDIPYEVFEPKPRRHVKKAYADNFAFSKAKSH